MSNSFLTARALLLRDSRVENFAEYAIIYYNYKYSSVSCFLVHTRDIGGEGGGTPLYKYIGMCRPKGYGF